MCIIRGIYDMINNLKIIISVKGEGLFFCEVFVKCFIKFLQKRLPLLFASCEPLFFSYGISPVCHSSAGKYKVSK